MDNNKLVGLKNQEYIGIEEDFQTVYFYGIENHD